MSYQAIEAGQLAAVVTFLEMRERPVPGLHSSTLQLRPITSPDVGEYRELFRLVGAPWLWFSRLIMDEPSLETIIKDPLVELFAVEDERGERVGMLELDFRQSKECELAFVGLVPEWSGQGHGRWLLAEALKRAWRGTVERVHVHTCTLDHPAALLAYRRAGFTPVRRAIERFQDPRLLGILPRDCAPRIPLIEP